MLDENDNTTTSTSPDTPADTPTDTAPSPADPTTTDAPGDGADTAGAPAKRTAARTSRKSAARAPRKSAAVGPDQPAFEVAEQGAELAPAQVSGDAAETAGAEQAPAEAPTKKAAKRTTAKRVAAKTTAKKAAAAKAPEQAPEQASEQAPAKATGKKAPAKRASKKTAATVAAPDDPDVTAAETDDRAAAPSVPVTAPSLLFKAPDPVAPPRRKKAEPAQAPPDERDTQTDPLSAPLPGGTGPGVAAQSDGSGGGALEEEPAAEDQTPDQDDADEADDTEDSDDEQGGNRRRRRRGGRRRRRGGGGDGADSADGGSGSADDGPDDSAAEPVDSGEDTGQGTGQGGRGSGQKNAGQKGSGRNAAQKAASGQGGQRASGPDRSDEPADSDGQDESAGSRRRRRRRRTGEDGDGGLDDPQNTVVRVRKPRSAEDEITSLHGSTRLEAKKQRRREGREAGRRRAPIVSEAEFLARREAVDRVMVIRQRNDLTQIAVLEDKVLVEHYVARESQTSFIGNVYLGRVQNVLPSMEAAFIDIGNGRNAVLYAGEVNWDSLGAGNGPRKIEQVLKSGQSIMVQVSKDPIGHKGARLTSQISLPGRFLVYVPDGTTSGISRKLPDTERTRLKTLLKEIVPDTAGVIVRTAAEGASEDELTLDVERLTARWSDIERKAEKGSAPQLLYGEPDLTLKVVRDLFTEDFARLVISGNEAWDMVDGYVKDVAPDLEERLERYTGDEDVFAAYRIDEQIAKGLDRKVWLPSGGSLIIDRTEAMTVVDVNTGKFTGSGGNLEETVTKNNLEAAEEMVRQLRLRDIGGIIVVDFIDMVLEGNRDLVLRRLVECLGRDRTRHQVAEVTSLGLVQMTRKRIGTGLLEAFSETCDHCQGRGVVIHHEPVEPRKKQDDEPRRGRRGRTRGSDGDDSQSSGGGRGNGTTVRSSPSPKDIAAIAKHEHKPVEVVPDPVAEPAAEPVTEPVTVPAVDSVPEPAVPGERPTDADGVATREVAVAPQEEPAAAADAIEPPSGTEPSPPASEGSSGTEPPSGTEPSPPASEGSSSPPAQEEPGEVGPLVEPVAPPVPAGPRLVTTRRRVARRPAGPPSGVPVSSVTVGQDIAQDGSGPHDGAATGGRSGDLDAPAPHGASLEHAHVPIKNKGRKR